MKIKKEKFGILKAVDSGFAGSLFGLLFAIFGVFMIIKGDTFVEKPPIWMAILFIAFGLLSFLFSTKKTLEINKMTGNISIVEQSLVKKKKEELTIKNIKAVLYEKETIMSKSGVQDMHWLALVTQDRIIDISSKKSMNIGVGPFYRKDLLPDREVGERIARFIGVPFTEAKAPNAYDVIQAVKDSISQHINQATQQQATKQNNKVNTNAKND